MNLSYMRHDCGKLVCWYVHDQDTGHISLCLLPQGMAPAYEKRRTWLDIPELRSAGLQCPAWEVGSLCHLEILEMGQSSGAGFTAKHGPATFALQYQEQNVLMVPGGKQIDTLLQAPAGYTVRHRLLYRDGEQGVEIHTTFFNNSGKPLTLEGMTSFALDGLSPFSTDDGPERLFLHRRLGGWSLEGKAACHSVEQLNLERTWYNGIPEGERYGSLGAYPVGRYFPFGAIEDRVAGIFWAAQLGCPSSWQMELTRPHDGYSFSGGLADREFGGWYKIVQDGESFDAPPAYLSVSDSLSRACQNLTAMFHRLADRQPLCEKQLPVMYNDWCAFWGAPNEEKTLKLAAACQGRNIPYLIIDAGWTKTVHEHLGQGGNGTWELDPQKFPHGLRWLSRRVAAMGMRLGIWFEFEVTTKGSPAFEPEYDDLHLTRDGVVIRTGGERSYWDLRKTDARAYLREKVIDFLRDNEIGYLKVDYNGDPGFGCDGAESMGEGLRTHMLAVQDFFREIRAALPDLVIENCASGGHRLEPSMMGLTALSSFSDAHECLEGPYIAANLHDLILPRQSQIWAVLHKEQSRRQMIYRLSAGFLGRLCLSGCIYELEAEQQALVDQAIAFYAKATPVIKYGYSDVRRDTNENQRYLRGAQMVVRKGDNGEILVVAHAFQLEEPVAFTTGLSQEEYRMKACFGEEEMLRCRGGKYEVTFADSYQAMACLLEPVAHCIECGAAEKAGEGL